MKEEWKSVGHSDFYVSSWGRVYNAKNKKLVKPYVHKSRCNLYLRVNMGRKKAMVHVLVASAFHFNPHGAKAQVDHKDTNTLNNSALNLEWVEPSTNLFLRHVRNKVELPQ